MRKPKNALFLLLSMGMVGGCRKIQEALFEPTFTIQHLVYYPSLQEIEAQVQAGSPLTLTQVVLAFPAETLAFDLNQDLPADDPVRVVLSSSSAPPDTLVEATFSYTNGDTTWVKVWNGALAWVEAYAAVIGRVVLPESTYVYVRWYVPSDSLHLEGDLRLVRGGPLRILWTDPDGLRAYQQGSSPSLQLLDTTFTGVLHVSAPIPSTMDTGVVILEYTASDTAIVDSRLLQVVSP